jgi:hypothetical protein
MEYSDPHVILCTLIRDPIRLVTCIVKGRKSEMKLSSSFANKHFTILMVALVTLVCSCQKGKTPDEGTVATIKDTLLITGVVTGLDTSKYDWKTLMLSKERKGAYGMVVDLDNGRLLNPHTKLNADGSFGLKVPHSYVADTTWVTPKFTLLGLSIERLEDSLGRMIVFHIDTTAGTIDLNKRFGKVLVKYQ